jgi:hypothetical protein
VQGNDRIEQAGANSDAEHHVDGPLPACWRRHTRLNLANCWSTKVLANVLATCATHADGEEVNFAIPLGTVAAGTAVKASVVKVRDH